MRTPDYEHLIVESIKGLPSRTLAEIADFVEFVRRRARARGSLAGTLRDLSRDEEAHLEEEFRDYDKLYPQE
jgi:hypothetical protein